MRILVADDDLVSRLAMEDVLRQCGAPEIVLAEDGASAWHQMTGEACFDLLCLDVRMPPPDGLELVARLRAAPALKRVPAMLITSTADRNTVLSATRSDLQGFLVKPVGPETVVRLLRVLAHFVRHRVRDRALYAKLRDYMIRVDDAVTCKTCGKKFDIPSQHSMVFIEKGGGAEKVYTGGDDEDSKFNR